MPLVSYNIPENHPSWENFKEGYMVKITFKHIDNKSESFWVWIDKIDKLEGDMVSGYVSNKLVTFNQPDRPNLRLGDIVTFSKKCIKEIANRYYSKEETLFMIENLKENPVTNYFESLNVKFKSY